MGEQRVANRALHGLLFLLAYLLSLVKDGRHRSDVHVLLVCSTFCLSSVSHI